ncbi:uncharacterized protein LOC110826948 [Zootermopsis nevadensis]|uniref:Uncharacterized protein n=1 Tax=Zootermopsis nevadensis TaxID=136037 RepID=A0A067RF19_ZOONE|nr:uncharacterized protein LOC110826948 [Zootermopsis nevadensis]KDR22367.1 hypothetical protein L798_01078 [Zootermopsis nevadensis]
MRRASEIQRQKNVVELREEMAQQSILHCQEEYLRSIQAIQEDLLRAKEDLKLITLNEEEHKSEFETLENRIQEFQSENRLLRAQIPHKDQELLTQDCLPWQNEEDLRSIHVVKAVLNVRHKPEGTVTGQDRKNAV